MSKSGRNTTFVLSLLLLISASIAMPDTDESALDSMPPILGIGKMTCREVAENFGFDDPRVISWVEGFITGMESARMAHLQIWGRRIGIATPTFITMELKWRCEKVDGSTPIAVIATQVLNEIPSDVPVEGE